MTGHQQPWSSCKDPREKVDKRLINVSDLPPVSDIPLSQQIRSLELEGNNVEP